MACVVAFSLRPAEKGEKSCGGGGIMPTPPPRGRRGVMVRPGERKRERVDFSSDFGH